MKRAPRKSVYTEIKTGGRYEARVPVVGEMVGDSRIIEYLGKRGGDCIWSALCGCGKMQIRSSAQINSALRRKHSLSCPECVTEYRTGRFGYLQDLRSAFRLERVLDGGPIWSDFEVIQLQDEIRADLEEEFGAIDPDSRMKLDDMQIAAGWPNGRKTQETRDREDVEAQMRKRRAKHASQQYRKAVEAPQRVDAAEVRAIANALIDRMKKVKALIKEREMLAGMAAMREERWARVMGGEDIVNPDKVTKKSAAESLAVAKKQKLEEEEILAWYEEHDRAGLT